VHIFNLESIAARSMKRPANPAPLALLKAVAVRRERMTNLTLDSQKRLGVFVPAGDPPAAVTLDDCAGTLEPLLK
jgi:hypothetical protein